MKTYLLKLTSKCNSNCIFCEIPIPSKKEPDSRDLNGILKEIKEKRKIFDELRLTGGEPTIYPKLFEILKYAKETCKYKRIRLESNGLMLYYKQFADRLIEYGVDYFQISFQTTDSLAYDKITRVKNSYNYVLKGIENIKAAKKQFCVNIVVHKYNYKLLPDIVKTLVSKGVTSIQLASLNPKGSNIENGKAIAGITYRESFPYIKKALDRAKDLKFGSIHIVNFPLCISKNLIDDWPDLIEIDREPSAAVRISKKKNEKCKECIYDHCCEGIWNDYLEQFGDVEFIPTKKICQ